MTRPKVRFQKPSEGAQAYRQWIVSSPKCLATGKTCSLSPSLKEMNTESPLAAWFMLPIREN